MPPYSCAPGVWTQSSTGGWCWRHSEGEQHWAVGQQAQQAAKHATWLLRPAEQRTLSCYYGCDICMLLAYYILVPEEACVAEPEP